MDELQREYDRFGPWAIEVSAEDPPPRIFVPYLTRTETPLLSIKIPHHIERRNARPGMDLYDFLVTLYEEDLVVMQRLGREVRTETCRLRDVQHLRVSRCLLRGNIHLGLPARPYDLPYNTVSDDLMLRLVELIRQRYQRDSAQLPLGDLAVPEDVLSFYFQRLLDAERRHDSGMHLLAFQGTLPVAQAEIGALRRAIFRVVDKRLLEAMHFSDGRELMILTRGRTYAYRWEVEYGVDTTYLPVRNIQAAGWTTDPSNGTTLLTLRTAGGETKCAFTADNESVASYAAWLAHLPGVGRAAGRDKAQLARQAA